MICNWKQHFDIQRSAAAGTQTTGTSTLSAEMKTFYDKTLLDNAEPQLVHDQFGQERNIPAHGGKTIEFRKFSSLAKATTALTEGVTPDGKSLTVTSKTATVAQYGDYIVQSDMLELTAIDNTIVEATRLLGDQAGRTLDTVTREVLAGGTNVLYCPKIATDGTETAVTARASLDATCLLTVKQVFRAAAILKAANAPKINGDYVAIIHPYVAYDLMMAAGDAWMDVHKYASPENIYNGEIGKLGGVRFVETTEAKIVSNGATSPQHFLHPVFGRGRLRQDQGGGQRPGSDCEAEGQQRQRRPAEPAFQRGLEGHQVRRAPERGVHGARGERKHLEQPGGGELITERTNSDEQREKKH